MQVLIVRKSLKATFRFEGSPFSVREMLHLPRVRSPRRSRAVADGHGDCTVTAQAPGSQPADTGPATTADHPGEMASAQQKTVEAGQTSCAKPLPAFRPGRQVGWIFKDGEAVAIERHESETRASEEPT
jgi:hypothetical protein